MRRIASTIIALFVTVGLYAAGSSEQARNVQAKITIVQQKVEIDKPMKAYAQSWGQANNVQVTVVTSGGDNGDYQTILRSGYSAGDMPDIFVIDGPIMYEQWESILADLSNEAWVKNTTVAYRNPSGKVVGFPVAIEGWGLAYNADILKKAGVDPTTLNNLAAYKDAFARIDSQKEELGLKSVVSMAASAGMSWVVADHNFNSYLSNGLKYGDTSVVEAVNNGIVDTKRLADYADWVELLFKYSDKTVLTSGTYDDQVGEFASGEAAFLHQGNWVDPNLAAANITFQCAYAPQGSMSTVTDGIFAASPTWYVINKNSKNIAAAKKYLSDLVSTEAGQKYMVNEAGMIPAFTNIELQPTGPLSLSVQDWMAKGKIYSWNQYLVPSELKSDRLSPIYGQFALGQIDKAKFIELFTQAIASLEE